MLSEVSIKNLGVIDSATLSLRPGLNVITGETGAGKTMVLTGLGLLLGARAERGDVRLGADQAQVDGVFELDGAVGDVPLEDGELFLSRTVTCSGRSRARVQGAPVPAAQLAEVGGQLVAVHGQSDQVALKASRVQRGTLDEFGGEELAAARRAYDVAWDSAVAAKAQLDEWLDGVDSYQLEAQHLREGLELWEKLSPEPGEEAQLDALIERLANAGELREAAAGAASLLRRGDLGEDVSSMLGRARALLEEAASLDGTLTEVAVRVQSLTVAADDLADSLESYLQNLEADPDALSRAYSRRADLRRLMRGRAASVEELCVWADSARERLSHVGDAPAHTEELREQLAQAQREVLELGRDLTSLRTAAAERLGQRVTEQLAQLAMPKARFSVELSPLDKPRSYGLEEVTFTLQPHPHAPARPLASGASGGELSRVMLALEIAMAGGSGKVFVFDEVDAGVGGQAAVEVGRKLAQLARTNQVLIVTHLAQVAAFADNHVLLEKSGDSTTLRTLDRDERRSELARMLSGQASPQAALEHAAALLDVADEVLGGSNG